MRLHAPRKPGSARNPHAKTEFSDTARVAAVARECTKDAGGPFALMAGDWVAEAEIDPRKLASIIEKLKTSGELRVVKVGGIWMYEAVT